MTFGSLHSYPSHSGVSFLIGEYHYVLWLVYSSLLDGANLLKGLNYWGLVLLFSFCHRQCRQWSWVNVSALQTQLSPLVWCLEAKFCGSWKLVQNVSKPFWVTDWEPCSLLALSCNKAGIFFFNLHLTVPYVLLHPKVRGRGGEKGYAIYWSSKVMNLWLEHRVRDGER